MGNKSTDLRVIRTKEAIQKALVDLIEEKGFEAITVKDITTKAGINRGTFYTHYEDKFDLMEKCQEEIMHGMANIVKQNFPAVIAELEDQSKTAPPLSTVAAIFELIDDHGEFMKAVLSSKGDLSFQIRLRNFMWETLFEKGAFIKEKDLLVPGEYLASYISSAHMGVIQQWLNNGKPQSPQEMAKILSTITTNGPFFAAGLKK